MFSGRYLIKDEVFAEDDTAEYKGVVEMADNTDECVRSYLAAFFKEYYYDNPSKVEAFISGDMSTWMLDLLEMCGEELNAGYKDFLDVNLTYSEYEYDIVLKMVNDEWIISSMTGMDGMDETIHPDIFDIDVNNTEDADTDAQEYIFPDSDSRYLAEEEVKGVETDKLRIARNEIFARHGYIFNDEELSQYFNNMSWYQGTVSSEEFNMDAVLNDFEKKNIELIEEIESGVNGTGNEQESGEFIIPAGTYVNNGLFEEHQALMKLTYYDDEEIRVQFLTEPQLNSINLYGFKIDDRTIQVVEEYEGIIVTLTWDSENEVTAVSSGEFTGMDSSLFNEMTNAHYSFVTGD